MARMDIAQAARQNVLRMQSVDAFLSAIAPIFAFTDGDRWRPGIGDPTFIGWFTVVAYFATAYLCWRAAGNSQYQRKIRWFWNGLAITSGKSGGFGTASPFCWFFSAST